MKYFLKAYYIYQYLKVNIIYIIRHLFYICDLSLLYPVYNKVLAFKKFPELKKSIGVTNILIFVYLA
tara:strand:+ start:32098 stop:32298 length:201 start_codon:yes stop_codon:yes gene_type:complete